MSNRETATGLIGEATVAGRSTPAAFGGGAVIGALGGLIGLGGAEFRFAAVDRRVSVCSTIEF
jgi:hypothetical protein